MCLGGDVTYMEAGVGSTVWDELTGVLGRLSARQACTWRPNTLWIMQTFFGGCVGVVEKGSVLPQSAAHVKGRQGENRQVRVGRELVGTRHRETSQHSQQPLTHGQPLGKGRKWALQTQRLGPCFGGEFRILVGCRKQRLIG